jgi:hypothetical protein
MVSAESLKMSDERETARSEVRHAGADERLFESLPAGKIKKHFSAEGLSLAQSYMRCILSLTETSFML